MGVSLLNIYLIPRESIYNITETEFTGKVTSYKIDGDKLTINLKSKETLIINYHLKSIDEKKYFESNLSLGDSIIAKGKLEVPSENTIFGGFNYKKYLYNKHIYYLVDADKIVKTTNNDSILYHLKNKITTRISKISKSKSYIKTFILGDKSLLEEEITTSYQNNGISHLFAISGMHVSLFAGFLLYFLKRISYSSKINYTIVILFLLLYLFLAAFQASIIRATIMFILFAINKIFNLKLENKDILLLVLIIILLIDPFYLFNVSFQFSYITSASLILLSKKISLIKNNILKSLYTSFICFMVALPISIYNFNAVNILGILLNLVYIPYVSLIVFPLSLLTFIFPLLDSILYIFIILMEKLTLLISSHNLGYITLSNINIYIIILYYILIILTIYKIKYIYLFIIMLTIHKNIMYLNNNAEITFLDVGQGDSTFIQMDHNKANILIDTGGVVKYEKESWAKRSKEYSIAKSKTIPYLKKRGVSKLDYLILTHGDFDHMGEAINLVNNFRVDKVILNCGAENSLEKELIKVLDKKKIKYYSCINELNIDSYKLQFLNTKEYDNENDNSSVIYLNYYNYKFLFMGDAGINKEKDILEKYNLSNINFLKVGHHGSNTSSSKQFISKINPDYSFISVGKNNRYDHPKEEVLDTLKSSTIYRTDLKGSIKVKLNKDKYSIETCNP